MTLGLFHSYYNQDSSSNLSQNQKQIPTKSQTQSPERIKIEETSNPTESSLATDSKSQQKLTAEVPSMAGSLPRSEHSQ